jgi:DNA repair protein RadC
MLSLLPASLASSTGFRMSDYASVALGAVIAAALKLLEQRQRYDPVNLNSPDAARSYLRLRIGMLEHEVFVKLCVHPD